MPWNEVTTYITGEKVTALEWEDAVENFEYLEEVAYVPKTTNTNITATTVGGANQIVSAGAITYEGAPHQIEFHCPLVSSINADINVILRDGTTVIGTLTQVQDGGPGRDLTLPYRLDVSAGSHTYNVAAWLSAADTVVFNAGSGGAAGSIATLLPVYIRIWRVPT